MSLEYWKAQAIKWKKAYWSTFNDTEEEKKEILKKAREKARKKAKAHRKNKKNTTGVKKTISKKAKTGDLFALF